MAPSLREPRRWGPWLLDQDPDPLSQPEPHHPRAWVRKVSPGKPHLPCASGPLEGSFLQDSGHCHPGPGLAATFLAFSASLGLSTPGLCRST